MKKNLTLIPAFLIVFAVVNSYSTSAQLTISIPKVPKIKKQEQPQRIDQQTIQNAATADTQTSQPTNTAEKNTFLKEESQLGNTSSSRKIKLLFGFY